MKKIIQLDFIEIYLVFTDGKSYIYSPALQTLSFKSLPIAHDGLLCKEMGLDKTIETMALINCNKRDIRKISDTYMHPDNGKKDESKDFIIQSNKEENQEKYNRNHATITKTSYNYSKVAKQNAGIPRMVLDIDILNLII